MTVPLAVVVPIAYGLSRPAAELMKGNVEGAAREAVRSIVLVEPTTGKLQAEYFWRFWGPLLIGSGMHKLAGILGINRTLAAAKVPFIRI